MGVFCYGSLRIFHWFPEMSVTLYRDGIPKDEIWSLPRTFPENTKSQTTEREREREREIVTIMHAYSTVQHDVRA